MMADASQLKVNGEVLEVKDVVARQAIANLGQRAHEADAPSDSNEYIRTNGEWAEPSGTGNGLDTGEIPVTPTNCTGDIIVRKLGKICELYISVKPDAQIAASGNLIIGYLPEGFRPLKKLTVQCGSRDRWGTLNICSDDESGELHYYNVSTAVATTSGLYAYTFFLV